MTQKPTYDELKQRLMGLEIKLSDLKLIEVALRESEEKYRNILENIEEGYFETDLAGNTIFFNAFATKILGYSRDELMGMNNRQYTDKENAKKLFQTFNKVYVTGKTHKGFDWAVIRKDGKKRDVEASVSLRKDSEGQPIGFRGIIRDVSERKRTEEKLRESEEKHRSILENIEDGYFEVDIAGNFTFFNDSVAKILGYSRDELMGMNNRQNTDEENAKKVYQTFNKVYTTGKTQKGFAWEIIRKDGSKVYIEASVSLRKNAEGQPIGFHGVARDVSERKQAEKSVLQSEKRFRDLFNSISDLIYTHDLKGRFISLNPAMEKLLGYEHDKLIGHKASDIMKPEFAAAFESEYLKPLKTQGYHEGVTIYFKKNSEKIYIEYHSTMVHPDDGEPYISGTGRNVTERVLSERKVTKLQEQLAQAQKMESIGTLAGGIAHDFNNILFPMFGYLEIMLEDVPKDNPLRGHLIEVFNGAKRARDLIKQILTFSRQSDHERKPLETQRVIKEALKLIKSSLPSTIEISQNIKSDCGLVMADPTHIHQIVMNLCTNAFHAMEEAGGKLTIALKEVELTAEDLKDPAMIPGPHVSLTVADTGPGMEQSIIDRIFDPYFTTKEEGKGTGLGLAVVHGIVKNHGGQISVYSEPGKGTEFQICFPIIKKQRETSKVETDTPIQKGDEQILLVDDQDIIVQIEKQMLERLGYHVTARISSIDALEAFRANPDKFDLIITDLTMPNMTGDKLAGELIKIRSDIPIILCTGFSELISEEKAKSLGIKEFLMKPVVMKDLSITIRKVLEVNNEANI
ncbi:MAG: PAS domain S-box protein [Deltaproteobacteria bacterium]|nr:PAS domain S-box protein [Deltaproteobacteria bacterium]MBW2249415.1 PAS domain S-box protein [Deltaproteobacteria bacterium]